MKQALPTRLLALAALTALLLPAGPGLAKAPVAGAGRLELAGEVGLQRALERIAADHKNGHQDVVVFDLDDTLVRTDYRNQAVMQEWLATPEGKPYAAKGPVTLADVPWGVDGLLARLAVPASERGAVMKFWGARFFTNAYLKYDRANPNAVAYACAVVKAGGHAAYLSGRTAATMKAGTEKSLQDLGFPWDPRGKQASLHLKTKQGQDDAAFKGEAAQEMLKLGPVVACVDNEPANCNALHQAIPQATTVLLAKPHSPNPPMLAPGILVAADFPTP